MIKSTGALLLFAALSAGQAIASDVAFRGNLLDRPCHVSGDSLNKHVVFKTRASRDFWYPPGRSPTESFVIRLENCHATAVGKIVTMTFKGTEAALPITKARGKRLPETVLSFLSARMLWQRRKPCGRRVWYPVIMKQQPRLN